MGVVNRRDIPWEYAGAATTNEARAPPITHTHAMVTTQNARLELIYMGCIRSKSGRGKWGDRLLPKHNHTKGQDIWKRSVMSEGCDWVPHNAGLADDKDAFNCTGAVQCLKVVSGTYIQRRRWWPALLSVSTKLKLCSCQCTTHVAIYGHAFEWYLVQQGQHLSLIGTCDVAYTWRKVYQYYFRVM